MDSKCYKTLDPYSTMVHSRLKVILIKFKTSYYYQKKYFDILNWKYKHFNLSLIFILWKYSFIWQFRYTKLHFSYRRIGNVIYYILKVYLYILKYRFIFIYNNGNNNWLRKMKGFKNQLDLSGFSIYFWNVIQSIHQSVIIFERFSIYLVSLYYNLK